MWWCDWKIDTLVMDDGSLLFVFFSGVMGWGYCIIFALRA